MVLPLIIPLGTSKKNKLIGPATLALVILNVAVHIYVTLFLPASSELMVKEINAKYLFTSGKVFSQYIKDHPSEFSKKEMLLSQKSDQNQEMSVYELGKLSIAHTKFSQSIFELKPFADQILFSWWKKKALKIQYQKKSTVTYNFGLTKGSGFLERITYQFLHGSWVHLLSNMIFLLLIGRVLESVIGPAAFLAVYLLGGICAGYFYSSLGYSSELPLVGASGSISCILSLWFVLFWNRRIAYLYFMLLPRAGYSGVAYMKSYGGLILWLSFDVVGILSQSASEVAYAAHIGGHLFGLALGGLVLAYFIAQGQATKNGLLTNNL